MKDTLVVSGSFQRVGLRNNEDPLVWLSALSYVLSEKRCFDRSPSLDSAGATELHWRPWKSSAVGCARSWIKAGKKPANCKTCGKTSPIPDVTLSDFLPARNDMGKRKSSQNASPAMSQRSVWFLGVTRRVNSRTQVAKTQSWRSARSLSNPRSTRKSKRTTNCAKFSRTCRRNTECSSTVTVSSRKGNDVG